MTNEQLFFLQMLSDHLHQRPTEVPTVALDWEQMVLYACQQQLEGIIFAQCGGAMPEPYHSRMEQRNAMTSYYYIQRKLLLEKVERALEQAEIPYFLVKGTVTAVWYPVPALRTMGDSDIVVPSERREQAHEIFLSLGLDCRVQDANEWMYFKDNMEIELHDRLLYNEAVNRKAHKSFINRYWEYVQDGELDSSFHFIFLLLHLRKHLMNSGVGFRQFMDVAVTMQKDTRLDWNWIARSLRELELTEFASVCFGLIDQWFGISAPLPHAISTAQAQENAKKVFANGVYGFADEENRMHTSFNALQGTRLPYLKMAYRALGSLFPSYETVYYVEQYSFVQGKPWLLPVVWGYRAVWGMKRYGVARLWQLLKKPFISRKNRELAQRTMESFGLGEASEKTKRG